MKTRLLGAFLWGLASALALPPVHLLPVLLFSVPALLRLVGEARSWRQLLFIAWSFGFGLNLAGLYWITEPILTEVQVFWWLVPFAAPLLALATGFFTAIPAFVAKLLRPGLGRLFGFAGAWVLTDLLRQFAFFCFPWNLWGTDWAIPHVDVFIQLAALIGVHGLTLLTVFIAGLPLFGGRGLAAAAALLLAWTGFGLVHERIPVQATGLKVALVQPDFPVPGSYDRASLLARWQVLLSMSKAGINAGAATVIWPEGASPWLLDSDAGARALLSNVTGGTPILAGSLRALSDTDYRNSIVATNGPGPPAAIYDKWKLVPFGEYIPKWIPLKITPDVLGSGFTPGTGPATDKVPGLPAYAPLICYEAIFSGQIVDHLHRPQWMVNVTDDSWFGNSAGPRQHFADVRLRAVEEGLPLARAANSGISAMVDGFGHVTALLPLGAQGVLVAELPNALPASPYAQFGLMIPVILAWTFIGLGILLGRGRNPEWH